MKKLFAASPIFTFIGLIIIKEYYFTPKTLMPLLGLFSIILGCICLIAGLIILIDRKQLFETIKKSKSIAALVVATAFIICLSILNIYYSTYSKELLTEKGVEIKSNVSHIKWEARGKIEGYFMYFSYIVANKEYVRSYRVDTSDFQINQDIFIVYNPENPKTRTTYR